MSCTPFYSAVFVLLPLTLWAADQPEVRADPEALSIFPLGGRRGTTVEATIRGRALEGAYSVWFDSKALSARVTKVETIRLEDKKEAGSPGHQVRLQVQIAPTAKLGLHSLRLIAGRGISNQLAFLVNRHPVIAETDTSHDISGNAQSVAFPVAINGRLSKKGEVDYYSFPTSPGQSLLFEVFSKCHETYFPTPSGFDSKLTLYEPRGSWFDSDLAVPLASNDEPSSARVNANPRLTYRFNAGGRYLVRVEAFLGKGGPDYSYQLLITPAIQDNLSAWPERPKDLGPVSNLLLRSFNDLVSLDSATRLRAFSRKLGMDRLQALGLRTALPSQFQTATGAEKLSTTGQGETPQSPTKGSARQASDTLPASVTEREPNEKVVHATQVSVPSLVEGTIGHAGDVDCFRLKVDSGRRLAFEIETPQVVPPHFSPRLELLDSNGRVLLSNVYKRIWREFTYYLKTLEAKTIYSFERGGEYLLKIGDVTGRRGGRGFAYRVLIRPQIPHVGEIHVTEERLNLAPGEAKALTIITGREEGFTDPIAISLKGLPEGVEFLPGTETEPERGDLFNEGNKENYVSRTSSVTLLLRARTDAPPTPRPQMLSIFGLPIVAGRPGPPLALSGYTVPVPTNGPAMTRSFPMRQIPLMVVPRRDIAAATEVSSKRSR